MYAVDAAVCPDGLPHEPKFSQMTAMHDAIAAAATSIVGAAVPNNPDQVGNGVAYVYNDVAFIEGAGNVSFHGHSFNVPAGSSSLVNLTSGETLFNTLTLANGMRKSLIFFFLLICPLVFLIVHKTIVFP